MKKMLLSVAAALALALVACTSVETAKVNGADIASNGEAVAVIQSTAFGLNLLWGFVPLADASLDQVVNKSLITEAKAMGGNKVEVVSMMRMNPNQFPFNFQPTLYLPGLVNMNLAMASGVAVK